MAKKRILNIVAALALFAAAVGVSGVVADSLGFAVTSQVHACSPGSSSGGGC